MASLNRGGCLTTLLIAMFIVNPLTAVYYLVGGDSVRHAVPHLPLWALPVFAVCGLLNLVFAIAVWRWQRWGLYGFIVSALVAFAVNLTYVGILPALLGLLGPVVLWLLLRPHWAHMSSSAAAA